MKKWMGSVAITALAMTSWAAASNAGLGLFSHGSYGSAGSSASYGSGGSHGGSYGSTGSVASSHGSTGSQGSSGGSTGLTLRQENLLSRADRQMAVSAARASASHGSTSHGSTGSAGSHGSASHGSYGSAGSYYGASHGSTGSHGGSAQSTGSQGGSAGTIRPALERKLHRAFRPSPSHGGSTGSTGSHGSASSHGGSTGSHGGYLTPAVHGSNGGSYGQYQSAVAAPATTTYAAMRPVAPIQMAAPVQQFAFVVVTLPQDATLYLGGHKTTTTGTVRKFKIPVTAAAVRSPYDVKVVLERNGQTFVANTQKNLAIGQTTTVKVNDVANSVNVATR